MDNYETFYDEMVTIENTFFIYFVLPFSENKNKRENELCEALSSKAEITKTTLTIKKKIL